MIRSEVCVYSPLCHTSRSLPIWGIRSPRLFIRPMLQAAIRPPAYLDALEERLDSEKEAGRSERRILFSVKEWRRHRSSTR